MEARVLTATITSCDCGYRDHRFCPKHGWAMRAIVKAGSRYGMEAAETVARAFEDPAVERACVACVVRLGAHETWCVETAILSAAREVTGRAVALGEVPGDSLVRAEVELAAEEALGPLPVAWQGQWTTLAELAALFEKAGAGR